MTTSSNHLLIHPAGLFTPGHAGLTGRLLVENGMIRAIGVSSRIGSPEVGKDADLVLLEESFNVDLTFVEAEKVFSR